MKYAAFLNWQGVALSLSLAWTSAQAAALLSPRTRSPRGDPQLHQKSIPASISRWWN